MLCYLRSSGRSAVRLARLLREQEVAGSIPVAPTNYIMPWNESHQSLFIVVSVTLLLMSGCTPKPKYHGRSQPKEPASTVTPESPSESPAKATVTTKSPTKSPAKAHIVFTAPVRDYSSRRLTSRYGVRKDPRYNTKEFHHGIDIKAESGDDVFASAPGTVIFSGKQSGFGKVIIIDHGKRFCTVSAHLSSILVNEGSRVGRGDVIGKVGRSGNATGVHLHFELRIEGKSVDPLRYLETNHEAQ